MTRLRSTKIDGSPFSESTIETVWKKGIKMPSLSSSTFRKDMCGAPIKRDKYGKTEQWGWEIDYKKPVSKGGGDELENLQPLQWENNRYKGDDWPNWLCAVRV
jgi:hypothetical protein